MKLFDKIERLRIESNLGVAEFLEKTGYSKTSYYSVKDNKSNSMTLKSAKKLTSLSNKYNEEWLMQGNDEITKVSFFDSEIFLEKDGVQFSVREIAAFVLDNEDAFFKDRVFKIWFKENMNHALDVFIKENNLERVVVKKGAK